MPTYAYHCDKCGHEFEAIQPMTAAPLKTCPEDLCKQKKWGKGRVKKQIGAGAGLLFKGGGFYITDYRSAGYQAAAKKDSTPAKSETKAEAKPAAKPDKK
jgi:putative FmdB family regulatory protein